MLDRIAFDWRKRHLIVMALGALVMAAFYASRPEFSPMHRWNRAFGDASIVLIAAAMAVGPLSRISPKFRFLLPWRRELGIYSVILAGIHTVIILAGWIEWDFVLLFGYAIHPATGTYVMLQQGFGLSNAIGIVALLYGLVLAATSNDLSMRKLGSSVWKFVQQGAYVLWILVVAHTAYFVYLHFQTFHVNAPPPNWAQIPMIILVGSVLALQFAAFLKTWSRRQRSDNRPDSGMLAESS